MFFAQNQEFLKSFGAQIEQPQSIQDLGQDSKICKTPVSNSSKKNSQAQRQKQKNSIYESQSMSQNQPVAQLTTSKKLNIITTSHKSRKFSVQCNELKSKKFLKHEQIDIKSQKSFDGEAIQNIVKQNHIDKSNKSISSKSYKFDLAEFQGSLMKKIRNLEARIKNIDLNYKNTIMKLKHENTKLSKEHDVFKKFLGQQHPEIMKQLNVLIEKLQQDSDSLFNSSDSEKQNDEIMPIMSKVQEIKFDGQKMCQIIKNYQETQIKKQQIIQTLSKEKKQQSEITESKKKFILRKYSIPENYKEKFSFQSAKLSEIMQQPENLNQKRTSANSTFQLSNQVENT